MTKVQKILVAGIIVVAPMGLFANANILNDKSTPSKEYSSLDSYKNHSIKQTHEVMQGRLQRKPKSGHIGVWRVSGTDIHVDKNTIVRNLNGGLRANDRLSIATQNQNGVVTALEIIKV